MSGLAPGALLIVSLAPLAVAVAWFCVEARRVRATQSRRRLDRAYVVVVAAAAWGYTWAVAARAMGW